MDWGVVGLFGLMVIAIWGITFAVETAGKPKRRREGTGEFEKYGPAATDEYIKLVDQRDGLYGRGLSDWRNSRLTEARTSWEKAQELGSAAATMALGMLAFRNGNRSGAEALWRTAAADGNVPAHLFLALLEEPPNIPLREHSNRGLTVPEFIDEVIDSERGEPWAMEGVVGVAAHYGCTAYAQQLSRKAWKVRHSRSHR